MLWSSYFQTLAYSTVRLSSSGVGTIQTQTFGIMGEIVYFGLPRHCKLQLGEFAKLDFPGSKLSDVIFGLRVRRAGEGKAEGQLTGFETSAGRFPLNDMQRQWDTWYPEVVAITDAAALALSKK